jgi:hypothetical protein
MKTVRLLMIPWLLLFLGCTSAIRLDKNVSDEMARNFERQAHRQKFKVVCGPGLNSYVYNGYPRGLTGSEIKTSIDVGETFCALLDQTETLLQAGTGDYPEITLKLKRINFAYSYEGNSILTDKRRDLDAAYILIRMDAVSGAWSREYTFLSEKERFDEQGRDNVKKYAIVNSALEEIIFQLYKKLYRDFHTQR